MRVSPSKLCQAAVLVSAALATAAHGQEGRPAPRQPAPPPAAPPPRERPALAAHRMEIYEGPNRTVHYFATAPGDRAAAWDLQRAENEWQYVMDLQALKRQYINSERILEPQRRYVQEQLYGTSISYGTSNLNAGYGYGWGYGYPGYVYPYAYPYFNGGYGTPGFSASLASTNTFVTRSLAYGMGDEGKLKDAMVQVIAQQAASPEYLVQAARHYAAAVDHAGTAPAVTAASVTLTLKGGDRVAGLKMREDGDWYVIDQGGGHEVRVRKSEVSRMDLAQSER
jgi:hypothetical protein